MKTLVLVRHGKSSWEYDVGDRDRPLKNRGINDANLVSNAFKKANFSPDKVFSSPANRAFSTCQIFMTNLMLDDGHLEVVEDLYDFGGSSVMNYLEQLPNSLEKVMIFGHNHAFTSIANRYGTEYITNLPTSGLVMIDFDIDSWSEINKGRTRMIITPKQLK